MARVLGLDTSSNTISVALTEDSALLAETTIYVGDNSLRYLVPIIRQVLVNSQKSLSSVDLISVTIGPGSWTGIRIGVETAKTIAQTTDIPVVGIYTLDALAASIRQTKLPVYSVLDGRRGNIIAGKFDCSGLIPIPKSEHILSRYQDFLNSIPEPSIIIGNGNDVLKQTGSWNANIHMDGAKYFETIYARNVCELGLIKFREKGSDKTLDLAPHYLQRSDAETQWEQRNL